MDTRNRNLMLLGGATVLFAGLAVLAITQSARDAAPAGEPEALFPGLSAQLGSLGEIVITTKTGSFHIRQTPEKAWVVAERGGFPANGATVRATATGVASLETVEAKTARQELHEFLGLVGPDMSGDAVRIALADTAGKPLADVLVSRNELMPEADGRNRLYVRRSAENQAWLARGSLTARPEIGDWLDRNVLSLTRARIASATVTPVTGPSYTVSRPSREHADFTVQNMPAGRELAYPGAANGVASSLLDFAFEDVRPVAEVDFARAGSLTLRSFDGLSVTTRTVERDGAHWAQLSAQSDTAERQAEAAAINTRAANFAFKLPEHLATTLLTPRDSLLKPVGGGIEIPSAP